MLNRSCATLFFASLAVLTTTSAHAQALLSDKKDITGFAARKVIEACIAEAARDRYPVALAVVDFGRIPDFVSSNRWSHGKYRRDRAAEGEDRGQIPPGDGRTL